MAINVNVVYKTVLSILNKEQRGYMTPDEFNKIATQVQLEIFEKYFDDLNQQLRVPENDSEYANRVKYIQEKIGKFETQSNLVLTAGAGALPAAVHRLGTVEFVDKLSLPVQAQKSTRHEVNLIRRSKLTAPTKKWPIYYIEDDGSGAANIKVYPQDIAQVTLEYVRKPLPVVWHFTVGSLGQYIHSTAAPNQDFEIDNTQQTEVILNILMYAGIIIRDPQIVQTAAGLVKQEEMNQKS